MSCAEHTESLLDGTARLPQDATAHVANCPTCRTLREGHLAASRLADEPVPSIPVPDYLALVSRRRRARVTLAAAAVSAGAAVALWLAPFDEPAVPSSSDVVAQVEPGSSAPETEPLRVVNEQPATSASDEAPADEAWALDRLVTNVNAYTARDLSVNDVTYASFGELPRWVAIPANTPVQFTLED